MKKAIILVLLISLFVFSGCADKNAGQESTPTPEATHTPDPTSTPTPTQEPTPKPTPMPTVEPGTGKYAGEVDETNGIKADFYEGGWDGQQAHRVNGSLCIQFFATTTFDKVGVCMPTWTQKQGHAATISLYAWQGSFDATLMKDPIATKEVADWADGVEVLLELDEEMPDGEYLYEIYNDNTNNVGIWYKPGTVDYVRTYYNNEIWDTGTPRLVVYYTKTPEHLHGPIQDSGLE
ncbi:MAG: hypothetical protein ACOX3J_13465 [Clostridia bacterium]|jgi:hypothetical protein